jgi:hypothetical protein
MVEENEDLAYKKIINCKNVMQLKILENIYLKLDVNGRIKVVRCNLRFKVMRE